MRNFVRNFPADVYPDAKTRRWIRGGREMGLANLTLLMLTSNIALTRLLCTFHATFGLGNKGR